MTFSMKRTSSSKIIKRKKRRSIIITIRRIKRLRMTTKSSLPKMWASSERWNPCSMAKDQTTKIIHSRRVWINRLKIHPKINLLRVRKKRGPEKTGISSGTTSRNGEPRSTSWRFQMMRQRSLKRLWGMMPTNRLMSSIWNKMESQKKKKTSLASKTSSFCRLKARPNNFGTC